jgi:hypothetical protein
LMSVALIDHTGQGHFPPIPNAVGTIDIKRVTGTLYLAISVLQSFGFLPIGMVTGQWYIDGAPLPNGVRTFGAALLWPTSAAYILDTTTVADGTHVVYFKATDADVIPLYLLKAHVAAIVIGNNGFSAGAQDLFLSTTFMEYMPVTPERVHYSGIPNPTNIARPYTYSFRPGVRGVDQGDPNLFLAEAVAEPKTQPPGTNPLYAAGPQWCGYGCVYPSGGPGVHTGDADGSFDSVMKDVGIDGSRFNNLTLAYATFIDKQDGSGWWGMDLTGRLFSYGFDGSVETIAGPHLDPSQLSFDPGDSGLDGNDAEILTRCIVEGNFVPNNFTLKGSTDICLDPRDHRIIYATMQVPSFIAKIDTSVAPANVTIYAGTPNSKGYTDGPSSSALFNEPSSIVMLSDGRMLVADFSNAAFRMISANGLTVSTVAGGTVGPPPPSVLTVQTDGGASSPTGTHPISGTGASAICYPYWVRPTSKGTFVFVEGYTQIIRELDLTASTVRRIGIAENSLLQNSDAPWIQLDVDYKGNCGPIDRIILSPAAFAGTDLGMWAVDNLDGTTGFNFGNIATAAVVQSAGDWGFMSKGYFPWAISFSRTENRMITDFLDNPQQITISAIPSNDDLVLGGYNLLHFVNGWYIFKAGTCLTFPWDCRPSFNVFYGDNGVSHLGLTTDENTFEDLMVKFPDDASLGAFIQAGMIGSTPRPELTGNDLRDLIYFIRRSSYAGSYPTPVSPGPDDPDTGNFPTITSLSAARVDATTIDVNWTTDKPTIGFAAACSSAQAAMGPDNVFYNLSPIEAGYTTSHSITLSNAPAVTPLHFIAVAKDHAGNMVYSNDQAVT